MKKFIKKLNFWVFPLLTLFFNQNALFCGNPENIYEKFAEDYLIGLNVPKLDLYQQPQNENLTGPEKKVTALSLFMQCESKKRYEDILSANFNQDIELFNGKLFSKINRSSTVFGEIELAKMLSTPTSKIEQLENTQAIVKGFIDNPELTKNLENHLDKVKKSEHQFLYLYTNKFIAENGALTQLYSHFPFMNKIASYLETSNIIATAETFESAIMHFQKSKETGGHLLGWLKSLIGKATQLPHENNKSIKSAGNYLRGLYHSDIPRNDEDVFKVDNNDNLLINGFKKVTNAVDASYTNFVNSSAFKKFITYWNYKRLTMEVAHIIEYWINLKDTATTKIAQVKQLKKLQQTLIHVVALLDNMNKMNSEIKKYPEIAKRIPALKDIENLVANAKHDSSKLTELLDLLQTDTCKEKASIVAKLRFGRLLVILNLLQKVRQYFIAALKAVGQVDAYMSIAKLYKEFENQRVKYTFVKYNNQEAPYINAKNFWHPVVNPEVVVTNNIELGQVGSNRSAIITGPNAGGKSTVLKSMLTVALLAQTIGIAPAEYVEMTPCEKIVSYMNITDNIGEGNSLFKAEAMRAFQLEKTLQANNRTFVVSDEMLTGTNPIEGTAAAYSIAKNFSNYKNAIVMLATHFPLLTKLEQVTNGCYKNYKVSVNAVENGKINYPYKLEAGIANQNVAIDILRLEGFDTKILDEANEIIKDFKEHNTNIFSANKAA